MPPPVRLGAALLARPPILPARPQILPARPPAWVGRYVGLPFESRGRGPEAYDCWGLVRLVLAEQFGVAVPSYTDAYGDAHAGGQVAPLIAAHRAEWTAVPAGAERLGDGVLLRTKGWPMHVGVMVAAGTMLHIEAGIDSVLERLDAPIWRHRVIGIYRHPGLN